VPDGVVVFAQAACQQSEFVVDYHIYPHFSPSTIATMATSAIRSAASLRQAAPGADVRAIVALIASSLLLPIGCRA